MIGEPQTREIAGSTFKVAPMPFKKGREGLMKLLAVVAPALGEALAGGSVMALLVDATFAKMLGDLLSALPTKLDGPTLEWFEAEFGARTTAEIVGEGEGGLKVPLKLDKDANREMVFGSLGYMAFFEWLAFCLEVNYSGFFGEALARIPGIKRAPSATPKP